MFFNCSSTHDWFVSYRIFLKWESKELITENAYCSEIRWEVWWFWVCGLQIFGRRGLIHGKRSFKKIRSRLRISADLKHTAKKTTERTHSRSDLHPRRHLWARWPLPSPSCTSASIGRVYWGISPRRFQIWVSGALFRCTTAFLWLTVIVSTR